VAAQVLNVDHVVYQLLRSPRDFDVVACPNMVGDIISDLGGLLVGSRGMTYSGNFTGDGFGVYQTNHGAAYDLAGQDRANPAGQILALAMLLEISAGQPELASLVRRALASAWRAGWRTADVASAGCRCVGTHEFARRVVEHVINPVCSHNLP
jgi:3-isopropylmalate dehydrogenase